MKGKKKTLEKGDQFRRVCTKKGRRDAGIKNRVKIGSCPGR